jgi:hypothetical protein
MKAHIVMATNFLMVVNLVYKPSRRQKTKPLYLCPKFFLVFFSRETSEKGRELLQFH